MSPKKSYSLETELVLNKSGDQYNASVPPLYQSATFKQPSLSNMGNTITRDRVTQQELICKTILPKL